MAVPPSSYVLLCQRMQAPSFPGCWGIRLAVEGRFWEKERGQ